MAAENTELISLIDPVNIIAMLQKQPNIAFFNKDMNEIYRSHYLLLSFAVFAGRCVNRYHIAHFDKCRNLNYQTRLNCRVF